MNKKLLRVLWTLCAGLAISTAAFAQSSLSGTVTDEAGEPIIGAYITVVEDRSVGTITDFDGNYELTLPSKAKQLEFSYTGYESQTVSVAGKAKIDIILRESSTHLDEVVAVGYGSQKAKEITSAVASVKSENFNAGVKENPMGLLQGKVAGLTISRSGGDPTNTSYNVQIRGTSTLDKGAGTQPLYIVDGIPVNSIDQIAPDDIASMDVLKDGSSAAIYGTRGTNGVIIITTKRGSSDGAECGSTTLEYAGYVSFATDATKKTMATADEFRGLDELTDGICKGSDYGKGYSTDWVKAMERDFAFTHNHNLAVSGATKNFNYRGSVTFKNAEGIATTSNRQEIMAKLAANQKALQGWLDLQYDFSYMHYRNDYNCGDFNNAAVLNPTFPIKNEDGSWFVPTGTVTANPVADDAQKESYQDGNYFRGSIKMTVNILKVPGLKINGFAALEEGDNNKYWANSKDYYKTADANKAGINYERSFNQLYELTLDYAGQWNSHSLALVGGVSYQNFWNDGHSLANGGFAMDNSKYYDLSAGSVDKEDMSVSSYRNSNTLIAYFARANYNYKEKYLLSASVRAEGSSRMGANNKWGVFPAASVGWRISGEDFMRDVKSVDDLKLRFGFGITGNNLGKDLQSVELLEPGTNTFNNHGTEAYPYSVHQNANSDLKWERKFEYNLGIDYAFFANRLYGSIDMYYRQTKDLLWEYTVPTPPYQYNKLLANAGEMHSMGIEIAITGVPVKTKDWNWTSTFTIAFNKNSIDKLSDPALGFNYETTWAGYLYGNRVNGMATQLLTTGQSVGTFYGYKWTGKFDDSGNCIYEDIDGSGTIDDKDKTVIGNAQPMFTFGWNNVLRWKDLDLTFFFRGGYGNDVLNVARIAYAPSKGSNGLNVFYSEAQGIANGTRTTFQSDFSDYYLEKGSYLKLDNITLGYRVPLKPNKYCQNLRFYFTVQNVFTASTYSGDDIDGVNTTSVWDPGIDYTDFYPTVRSYLIGANVTF